VQVVVSLIRDTLPEFVWGTKDNHEQSLRKAGFRPEVWTRVLPNANQELYPDDCVFQSAEEYLYVSIPFLKTCFLTRIQYAVSVLGMEKSGKEKYPNLSYCKLGQLIHRCLLTSTDGSIGLFFLLEKGYEWFFFFSLWIRPIEQ
jgi:hypothetical protein